jgi:DNA-binding NarL/FixJ family response regulator
MGATEPAATRVIVAEGASLLRDTMAALLTDAGLEVVGRCQDAASLLAHVETAAPDAVVIDVRLPPTRTDEGLRAAREIRRRWPAVGILVLSSHPELPAVERLFGGGSASMGFLLRDQVADAATFVAAVRQVGTAAR